MRFMEPGAIPGPAGPPLPELRRVTSLVLVLRMVGCTALGHGAYLSKRQTFHQVRTDSVARGHGTLGRRGIDFRDPIRIFYSVEREAH